MIEAITAGENERNRFTVDWDGPDDPDNPKKSDPPQNMIRNSKSPSTAGNSAKNGS